MDRLGALVRSPTAVTAATAALAAFVAAAVTAGGVQALLAQCRILPPNESVRVVSREERLLRHVFQRAAEGDARSVLSVMDDFGWRTEFHMSIGDTKGAFLSDEVANRKPKVAVEIGQQPPHTATPTALSAQHSPRTSLPAN